MQILFLKSTDDPKKLIKTFTNIYSTDPPTTPINNTQSTMSLLYPSFIVAYHSAILGATHVQVTEWGSRIYSITNISFETGGKLVVNCAIDVLATYGDSIKNCKCSITRSESAGINWVPDDKFPIDTMHTITKGESSTFTSPFTKTSAAPWVLTVINNTNTVQPPAQRSDKKDGSSK